MPARHALRSSAPPGEPDSPGRERLALALSGASLLLVAFVASLRNSPLQAGGAFSTELAPFTTAALFPFAVPASVLKTAAAAAIVFAALAFLGTAKAAWRGRIATRPALVLTVFFQLLALVLPVLLSRDSYSYAIDGRILGVHHANPYVATPHDYPSDPLSTSVGARWQTSTSVYGPLFLLLSAGLTRLFSNPEVALQALRVIAVAAALATLALVVWLTRRLAPTRTAYAVVVFGLNPLVIFDTLAGGHNDPLIGLAVSGALVLVLLERRLLAVLVLTLAALVKVIAIVPLAFLLLASARDESGWRVRNLLAPLALVAALAAATSAPFVTRANPTLFLSGLLGNDGGIAPQILARRVAHELGSFLAGDTGASVLDAIVRFAFLALLLAALAVLAVRLLQAKRPDGAEPGATWGTAFLLVLLTGTILHPWYALWLLPIVWLLNGSSQVYALALSTLLSISLISSEPRHYGEAFSTLMDINRWSCMAIAAGLLVVLARDLLGRRRSFTVIGLRS
jgi:alpha-1,6-mannosyltransferase